jgi:hypothetical protein
MLQCADGQIDLLEKTIVGRVKLKPEFELLKTTPGIGHTLSLTIMLETGDISRFATVGDYASYGRCVDSQKIRNGKKKGSANIKNGNKYFGLGLCRGGQLRGSIQCEDQEFCPRTASKETQTSPNVVISSCENDWECLGLPGLCDGLSSIRNQ